MNIFLLNLKTPNTIQIYKLGRDGSRAKNYIINHCLNQSHRGEKQDKETKIKFKKQKSS